MTPKDVLTNKTFCPMPWTGLMYNFDGNVKNCIRSANRLGNIQDAPIEDILLSHSNIARQAMITAKQPPSNCKPCRDLEVGKNSFDIISDRLFYIRELKNVPLSTYKPNNFDLRTIDVRWSNLCNFACVYCGPEFSSKWAAEENVIPIVPTDEQRDKFKNYIMERATQLDHVYLAGGEPLLMKENLELLDRLRPETNLRINTNLSKVDTRVFDRICQFKNVHWIVSLETIEEEYEYIRYGAVWQDFLDNLNTIRNLGHKISFNMLHFILNYQSIFGCVDYLSSMGFHNNSFIIGALLQPDYLNIRHLPDNTLNSVKATLEKRIAANPGFLLEDSYKNMLGYIQQPISKNFDESMRQLAKLDSRRNLNSRETFKNLYQETNYGN
jgi:sulfatase maturation enzyme AslB (radical SAM superfamily)